MSSILQDLFCMVHRFDVSILGNGESGKEEQEAYDNADANYIMLPEEVY